MTKTRLLQFSLPTAVLLGSSIGLLTMKADDTQVLSAYCHVRRGATAYAGPCQYTDGMLHVRGEHTTEARLYVDATPSNEAYTVGVQSAPFPVVTLRRGDLSVLVVPQPGASDWQHGRTTVETGETFLNWAPDTRGRWGLALSWR